MILSPLGKTGIPGPVWQSGPVGRFPAKKIPKSAEPVRVPSVDGNQWTVGLAHCEKREEVIFREPFRAILSSSGHRQRAMHILFVTFEITFPGLHENEPRAGRTRLRSAAV
jgi:hypothetical protein